jgi:F-type H+-transporting ATPase subunit epsilon
MAKSFHLNVLSPEKTLYEGKAVSLVAPAALGYMGVLADHAPLAANLKEGKIIIIKESGESVVFYSKAAGFLQVLKNNVSVILDSSSS